MAAAFQDYYTTLGVARDATADAIKKAFRKLAREFHPDLAKDKTAGEAKFKEINEANEVLSDPAKRAKYDELGAGWQEDGRGAETAPEDGAWSRGGGSAERAYHFTGTGFSDFFEQYFGGGQRFGFERDGAVPGSGARVRRRPGADVEGEILVTLSEVMHGTVRPISLRTADRRTGRAETRAFEVRIPAGASEGRRIRVPGQGEPGDAGAPDGDLYLRVRFATHPDFRAEGADLVHDVELAPWDTVLGTAVDVPSFEGPIRVRVPAGTQPGARLRVRGHGLPRGKSGARGDLHVVVAVTIPAAVSARERGLWEDLRAAAAAPAGAT